MNARLRMPTRMGLAFTLLVAAMLFAVLMPAFALGVGIPADTVMGLVRDKDDQAIAGVMVILEDSDGDSIGSTTSGPTGGFSFTGLASGDYAVEVLPTDGLLGDRDEFQLNGVSGYYSYLTMYPPEITGTLTSGGETVQDARLTLYYRESPSDSWNEVDEEYTDDSGEYQFGGLSDGEYAVGYLGQQTGAGEFFDPQYYDGSATLAGADVLDVALGDTLAGIDLDLTRSLPSVAGTVRNGSGTGVADIGVIAFREYAPGAWESFSTTATTADGSYVLYGLPAGVYRIGTEQQKSKATFWAAAFHTATGPSAPSVMLGSDVTVASQSTASGKNITQSATEILTRDAYEADDVSGQAKGILADGFFQNRTLFPGPDDDWISLQVTAGHTYTIETSASAVLPGWSNGTDTWMELYDSNGTSLIAYDDDSGNSTFSKLTWTAPATKTVLLRVTDYSSANGSTPEQGAYGIRVVDADVSATAGRISGLVTDSVTHNGIGGMRVELDSDDVYATALTDSTGHYTMEGLPIGSYNVTPSGPAYEETASIGVAIVNPGDDMVQDFVMVPKTDSKPTELYGYAFSDGSELSAVAVTVTRTGSAETSSATSDSDGYYDFVGLAAGTYSVTFSKAGYQSAVYTGVQLVSGGHASRSGNLLELGGLSGTVMVPGGAPLAGVAVTIDGAVRATTLADGKYSVPWLPLGSHTVTYSKAGYTPYSQGFSVASGVTTVVNPTLATVPIVVTTPIVRRTPSKATLSYKRKKGKAKYTLSANVRDVSGAALAGRLVYLQTSKNGKSGWKKLPGVMTNASGNAGKTFTAKKKATLYYRWYVPATSTHNAVILGKQKVTIK